MTLKTYDVEQGTDSWLEVRRGILTASVMGQLITTRHKTAIDFPCNECGVTANQPCNGKSGQPIQTMHKARTAEAKDDTTPPDLIPANNPESRSITAELAAERITGHTDDSYSSFDMERGHIVEPLAVHAYMRQTDNPVTHLGFMTEDQWGFKIGCSPDGLVDDDGMVEIKSRKPRIQLQTFLADRVPAANMAQLQCALLVSGRDWIDYVSFSSGMPLFIKTVKPDPRWFRAIVAAATEFETAVTQMQATYEARTHRLLPTERIDYNRVELKLS